MFNQPLGGLQPNQDDLNNPPPQPQEQLSVGVSDQPQSDQFALSGPSTLTPNLSSEVLNQRSHKIAVGTGMNTEDVKTQLTSPGGEERLTTYAGKKDVIDKSNQRLTLIDQELKDSASTGTPVTPEQVAFIKALSDKDVSDIHLDPGILHQKFAEAAVGATFANMDNSAYMYGVNNNPTLTDMVHQHAEDNVRTKEHVQKLLEDNVKETGWGGYLWDKAQQMVPLLSDWRKYDQYTEAGTGWMPGSNMAAQMQNLWSLKPQDREAKIDQKFEEIKAKNPLDARDWLENVLSFSRSDAAWSNIGTAVDVASVVPVGAIAKGLKAGSELAKGVSEVSKVDEAAKSMSSVDKGLQITQLKSLDDALSAKLRSRMFSRDNTSLIAQRADVQARINALTPEIEQSAKASVQALGPKKLDPIRTLDGTGQVEKAADGILEENLQVMKGNDTTVKGNDIEQIRQQLHSTSSTFDTTKYFAGKPTLAAEAGRRILEATSQIRATLYKTLDNTQSAMRLTPEGEQAAIQVAKDKLKTLYNNTDGAIMSTEFQNQTMNEAQLNNVSVYLGKTDATPFKTAEEAVQAAENKYGIKRDDYTVHDQGQGYAIKLTRPMDESDPMLLGAKYQTTYTNTPRSVANTFLGRFRTPEDLLSPESRANRNIVTPVAQQHIKLFQDAVAPSLQKLSSRERSNLDEYMKAERNYQTGTERGRFTQSQSEFELRWKDSFKSYPSEEISQAYLAMREMNDFDYTVRTLALKRDKGSQGILNIHHEYESLAPGVGDKQVKGYNVNKYQFEGKEIPELPKASGKDNPGVYVVRQGGDGGHKAEWKSLNTVDRSELERLTKEQGYKVYHAADMNRSALADVSGDKAPAAFYVLKGASTSNLRAADMLPFKAGWHVTYPSGFYTKIPTFFRNPEGVRMLGGDLSIAQHTTEAQAKKYSGLMDQARQLYRDNKMDEFTKFVTKNLPQTPDEFKTLYEKGLADVDSPFMYVRQGQSTVDAAKGHMGQHFGLFQDAQSLSDSKFNLLDGVNKKFTQEKDIALPTVRDGTEGKPVFDFSPSRDISALATMQQQMHALVKLRVYDNYVKQSISSFVREFTNPEVEGGSVTRWRPDQIQNNPLSFINDPKWDKSVVNKDKLAAAMNVHRSIVNILGMPSEGARNLDWVMNKVASSAYERFGDTFAEKVSDFQHFSLSDPARYARSMAFHAKLGLFNPVQLFIQGQGIGHTIALTGNIQRSWKAGAASTFMRFLSLTDNPGVIDSFAQKAGKFGVNPEDFKEAHSLLKDIGIWNVEGDVAQLDDAMTHNFFSGKAHNLLDKGMVFFKEGERFVRMNAFNTAYFEWKEANVGKSLIGDQRAINTVMTRYDDLALNMTRKSTADIQKGLMSIPTQFSTYTFHIMEQMMGKRLTTGEKLRAFSMYTALYGLPAGIYSAAPYAIGPSGNPLGDDLKEAALKRGIDLNSGVLDTLMHGMISTAVTAATGQQTSIGERYGPNSLGFVSNAFTGKKSMMDILGGPGVQTTKDVFTAAYRSVSPVLSSITDAGKDTQESYPIMAQDWVTAARNISSVDNVVKVYVATNQHKYMNKNEIYTTDADTTTGLLAGVLGAEPRALSDMYLKQDVLKQIKDYKYKAGLEVTKNVQRALDNATDPDAYLMYMKAAKMERISGGLSESEYRAATKAAMTHEYMTKTEQVDQQWLKKGPNGLADIYTLKGN